MFFYYIYNQGDEKMRTIHVETVKIVFVESSDRRKNWPQNPLINSGVQ